MGSSVHLYLRDHAYAKKVRRTCFSNGILGGMWKMKLIEGEFSFLKEKGHVISIVGAGGKTTLMYWLAETFAENGARVLVTTTTHIYQPEEEHWAKNCRELTGLWSRGTYAVMGTPDGNGKLTGLPEEKLKSCMKMADVVLIEADGARRLPCKVPAAHEPVIPDSSDIVIGVMGMSALGKTLNEVCFRAEEAAKLLGVTPEERLTEEMMAEILASGQGTRKNVGMREYYVVLNQCDSKRYIKVGKEIIKLLPERYHAKAVLTSCL